MTIIGENYIRFDWAMKRLYGAQNEAYKCPLVEKVVNDLCFS